MLFQVLLVAIDGVEVALPGRLVRRIGLGRRSKAQPGRQKGGAKSKGDERAVG